MKLWHLGPPFLGSKPPGAVRPNFDQAKEAKIQLIAKKIKAGIDAKKSDSDSGSEEDVPPTQDSKPDTSLHIVSTSPASRNASIVVTPAPEVSSTPCIPPTSGLSSEMKAEFTQLMNSTVDSFAKLLEGRGDLSMDGEVLDHVQVKLPRLRCLLYLFSTGITFTRTPGTSPKQPGAHGSSVSQARTPLSPDRTLQLLPGSGSRSISKPSIPTVTGSCSRKQLGPFQEDGLVLPGVSSSPHPSDGNGDGKPNEDSVSK